MITKKIKRYSVLCFTLLSVFLLAIAAVLIRPVRADGEGQLEVTELGIYTSSDPAGSFTNELTTEEDGSRSFRFAGAGDFIRNAGARLNVGGSVTFSFDLQRSEEYTGGWLGFCVGSNFTNPSYPNAAYPLRYYALAGAENTAAFGNSVNETAKTTGVMFPADGKNYNYRVIATRETEDGVGFRILRKEASEENYAEIENISGVTYVAPLSVIFASEGNPITIRNVRFEKSDVEQEPSASLNIYASYDPAGSFTNELTTEEDGSRSFRFAGAGDFIRNEGQELNAGERIAMTFELTVTDPLTGWLSFTLGGDFSNPTYPNAAYPMRLYSADGASNTAPFGDSGADAEKTLNFMFPADGKTYGYLVTASVEEGRTDVTFEISRKGADDLDYVSLERITGLPLRESMAVIMASEGNAVTLKKVSFEKTEIPEPKFETELKIYNSRHESYTNSLTTEEDGSTTFVFAGKGDYVRNAGTYLNVGGKLVMEFVCGKKTWSASGWMGILVAGNVTSPAYPHMAGYAMRYYHSTEGAVNMGTFGDSVPETGKTIQTLFQPGVNATYRLTLTRDTLDTAVLEIARKAKGEEAYTVFEVIRELPVYDRMSIVVASEGNKATFKNLRYFKYDSADPTPEGSVSTYSKRAKTTGEEWWFTEGGGYFRNEVVDLKNDPELGEGSRLTLTFDISAAEADREAWLGFVIVGSFTGEAYPFNASIGGDAGPMYYFSQDGLQTTGHESGMLEDPEIYGGKTAAELTYAAVFPQPAEGQVNSYRVSVTYMNGLIDFLFERKLAGETEWTPVLGKSGLIAYVNDGGPAIAVTNEMNNATCEKYIRFRNVSYVTDVRDVFAITYCQSEEDGGNKASSKNYLAGGSYEVTLAGDVSFAKFVREGYVLVGWTDGQNVYEAGLEGFTLDKAVTLTAVYEKGVSVVYDMSGENVSAPVQKNVKSGTAITLASAPAVAGKNFLCWQIGEERRQPGETFTVIGDSENAADRKVTIVAVYEDIVYTVAYDLAGGSFAEAVSGGKVTYGGTFAVTDRIPERKGYAFSDFTVGGEAVKPGEVLTLTDNTVILANWTANKHSVSYDLAGGEGKTEDAADVSYDSDYTVSGTEPTRRGYDFGGWSWKDTVYRKGDVLKMGDEDVLFTAVWTKKTYSVTVTAEHASVDIPETVEYGGEYVFTVTVEKGYELISVKADVTGGVGGLQELVADGDGRYTIIVGTADVEIEAVTKAVSGGSGSDGSAENPGCGSVGNFAGCAAILALAAGTALRKRKKI